MHASMRRNVVPALSAGLIALVAACDTSVTNPGPTPDDFLNNPDAFAAVVAGARRTLSDALNTDRGAFTLYWSAAVTFEINPAGSTGSFGIPVDVQSGSVDAGTSNAPWGTANEARFVAEDAIRRFNEIGASNALLAEVSLFAGYANRLLGETFCQAVIPPPDGGFGSPSPHTDYFTRAEAHFASAVTLGTGDIQTAARAGLASVRASLGNWGGAASEAALVPDGFVFQAAYSDQDQNQFNALVWANGDAPYRAHTEWGTFAEAYSFFLEPNDSRINIILPGPGDPQTGDAGVAKFGGQVPWHRQDKYPETSSGVNLSSGWEMRLIEAEAALAGGNAGPAVDLMNIRRADLGLALYDNTVSVDSAYSLLKLERQLELWLENRRMGDLRRWINAGTPGVVTDGLYVDNDGPDGVSSLDGSTDDDGLTESGPVETMTNPVARALCFPLSANEIDTNPNVS